MANKLVVNLVPYWLPVEPGMPHGLTPGQVVNRVSSYMWVPDGESTDFSLVSGSQILVAPAVLGEPVGVFAAQYFNFIWHGEQLLLLNSAALGPNQITNRNISGDTVRLDANDAAVGPALARANRWSIFNNL